MTAPSLPPPGSPGFVPSLLSHVTEHESLNGWKPDPVLFSTILLALIVNKGGIIIDVEREEGTSTRKSLLQVVQNVVAVTNSIFGLKSAHAHLSSDSNPQSIPYHFIHDPQTQATPTISRNPSSVHTQYASAASSPGFGFLSEFSTPRTFRYNSTASSSRPGLSQSNETQAFNPVVPDVLVITGLENSNSPAMIKFVDILTRRYLEFEEESIKRDLPAGFLVIWVRDELSKDVPGWVADQFAASAVTRSSDLQRPPEDLELKALISSDYIAKISALLPYTHIHPPLQIHISNLLSALTAHPRLHCTITGRAHTLFAQFVRAHRLLSSPFTLPQDWEDGLNRLNGKLRGESSQEERFGVGGGRGGVNTWARRAGEEPSIAELAADEVQAEVEEEGSMDEWYATPKNVEGVWRLCTRHRTRARKDKGEVMWLIKGSAGNGPIKALGDRARKQEVERILEEIIKTV